MSGLFDEPASPSAPTPTNPTLPFDIVKEIHMQNTHIQLLEQQRETKAQALLQANAQLTKVQEWAQEADQRTREIMGLVGQQ